MGEQAATKHQYRELRRLASAHGKLPPRDGLTYEEAADAILAMKRLPERGAKSPIPESDPTLQPHETLRDWYPYRRTGQSRGTGERMA